MIDGTVDYFQKHIIAKDAKPHVYSRNSILLWDLIETAAKKF
jgi:hypothetical protein